MGTKKATIRQLIITSLGAKAGLEHRKQPYAFK